MLVKAASESNAAAGIREKDDNKMQLSKSSQEPPKILPKEIKLDHSAEEEDSTCMLKRHFIVSGQRLLA